MKDLRIEKLKKVLEEKEVKDVKKGEIKKEEEKKEVIKNEVKGEIKMKNEMKNEIKEDEKKVEIGSFYFSRKNKNGVDMWIVCSVISNGEYKFIIESELKSSLKGISFVKINCEKLKDDVKDLSYRNCVNKGMGYIGEWLKENVGIEVDLNSERRKEIEKLKKEVM